MIRILFFCGLLPIIFLSCSETTPKKKTKKNPSIEVRNEPDYDHIIAESINDYPTTLRSDKTMLIYDRMVLEIELDSTGQFTIEGKPANWEKLEEEVKLFFNANRDLGNSQTNAALKNEQYRYHDYPFYSYFTKESYESFLNQLTEMAENDLTAALYLQRHARRIKAFDAVDDREIGFINPLAVIRYIGDENVTEEQFAALEKHLAIYIYHQRSELAYEKFGVNYEEIRRKAHSDKTAQVQLLYLQEMYPAYLLRVTAANLERLDPIPPPPPMPTSPPVEEIIEAEDEPEMQLPN